MTRTIDAALMMVAMLLLVGAVAIAPDPSRPAPLLLAAR